MPSLDRLNRLDRPAFVAAVGHVFEHSPWIAERAWDRRPFESVVQLWETMVEVVDGADEEEKLALIRAHPDLVGRAAREGSLTPDSTREQAAAGLGDLTPAEIDEFERSNRAYRDRFDFPFVICARENKKVAILEAFPRRLQNSREEEIRTALSEIARIARLRLEDEVGD